MSKLAAVEADIAQVGSRSGFRCPIRLSQRFLCPQQLMAMIPDSKSDDDSADAPETSTDAELSKFQRMAAESKVLPIVV
jgi:hypothetical protein